MRSNKLTKIIITSTLALSLLAVPVSQATVLAAETTSESTSSSSTTQTHTLNKSYVVYGAGAALRHGLRADAPDCAGNGRPACHGFVGKGHDDKAAGADHRL